MNPDLHSIANTLAAMQHKGFWDYASLILSGLALIVVAYYTFETFQLRRAAQKQIEIQVMPMFALYVYRQNNHRRLMLKNVGLGTAFNLSINKPRWGKQSLEFIYNNHNVMQPGNKRTIHLHHDDGNQSGTKIDSADRVYELVNRDEFPNPLEVIITCESVYLTRYEFVFHFTPGSDFRLKIALCDVRSFPKGR